MTVAPAMTAPPPDCVTVPVTRPDWASATAAAKASTRPHPVSLLGIGLPRGTTVLVIRNSVRVMLKVGLSERSNAAIPATCGAAIEVPFIEP